MGLIPTSCIPSPTRFTRSCQQHPTHALVLLPTNAAQVSPGWGAPSRAISSRETFLAVLDAVATLSTIGVAKLRAHWLQLIADGLQDDAPMTPAEFVISPTTR